MGPFDVFHIDGERGFRGGERQLLYLAAALRARGHGNVICCRSGHELEKEAKRQKFNTLALPFLFEFDPLSAWLLARQTGRRRRPVLHAHTAHAAGIAAIAGKLRGLKPVVHRRVDFALSGGLSRRLKYESAGRVIAVSRAIADVLSNDGLARDLVTVVPDALPADAREWAWAGAEGARFSPASPRQREVARAALAAEFGIDARKDWVGNLAALVPHKDHDTLIAAALIVLLERPATVFLIAGRGPEEQRLLASIKRMGLLGRVLLLGHREDAAQLLGALDAFVLSSWGEGMGSVLLEAAACGVPVAATSAGGIPELVADGRSGLLAPPRDPEALARRIIQLLDDRDLARRLAAGALETLPRFGLERAAERMEQVYDAVA